ncbi:hypothetical protein [Rickettsia endosymbiont of Polydrusus tereticollis]
MTSKIRATQQCCTGMTLKPFLSHATMPVDSGAVASSQCRTLLSNPLR